MAIKLESGKRYVRRDGKVSGPLAIAHNDEYPFVDEVHDEDYMADGSYIMTSLERPEDLVEEATEQKDTLREQRRYEIAKVVLTALISSESVADGYYPTSSAAARVVELADALLAELEK